MKSVCFVIPFRSKAKSNNWSFHCAQLRRTLESLLNTTSENFHVVVVVSDVPQNQLINDKITYVDFDLDFMSRNEIILDFEPEDWRWYEFAMDHARRVCKGINYARELRMFDYFMSLDADDLISNNLSNYLGLTDSDSSYYVGKGFEFYENLNRLKKIDRNFNLICGSSHILRECSIPIFDMTQRSFHYFDFFTSHGWIKTKLMGAGEKFIEIDFPAVCYVKSKNNWSHSLLSLFGIIKYGMKNFWFKLIFTKPNFQQKLEFGLRVLN
jgi:hypothetical protein